MCRCGIRSLWFGVAAGRTGKEYQANKIRAQGLRYVHDECFSARLLRCDLCFDSPTLWKGLPWGNFSSKQACKSDWVDLLNQVQHRLSVAPHQRNDKRVNIKKHKLHVILTVAVARRSLLQVRPPAKVPRPQSDQHVRSAT